MATMPRERPGAGDRFFANLAYLVPGYQGYKQRDSRRDEDARLRQRVLDHLGEISRVLETRRERLTELSLDRAAERLSAQQARVEKLSRTVRFAPHALAAFFDAESIGEGRLEKLLEHDLLLFQDLDDLLEFLRGTSFPPSTASGFERFFVALGQGIDRVARRVVARDTLLGSA